MKHYLKLNLRSLRSVIAIIAVPIFTFKIQMSFAFEKCNTYDLRIIIASDNHCGPCKSLEEKIAQYSHVESIYEGKSYQIPFKILKNDIPKEKDEMTSLRINSDFTPQMFVLLNGEMKMKLRIEGLDIQGLKANIDKYFQNYPPGNTSCEDSMLLIPKSTTQLFKDYRNKAGTLVAFIGTGRNAQESPIFIGESLHFIQNALMTNFNITNDQFVNLFGSGGNSRDPDFFKKKSANDQNGIAVKMDKIQSHGSFTSENLSTLIEEINEYRPENVLFILSGHGDRYGVSTWGGERLSLSVLGSMISSIQSTRSYIISGNCYGGALASHIVGSCGFFGASPYVPASGCWESDDSRVVDYSSEFFKAVSSGKIQTFHQAHFLASEKLRDEDTPYTTYDEVVEKFFLRNVDKLQKNITIEEALKLPYTYNEYIALEKITANLDRNSDVSLEKVKVDFYVMPFDKGTENYKTKIYGKTEVSITGSIYESEAQFTDQDKKKLLNYWINEVYELQGKYNSKVARNFKKKN